MNNIVCPACAATNRVPTERTAQAARCGKCHSALFTGRPLPLALGGLARHVEKNSIPLVVDFWADWCGPCKMMVPEFEKAAQALEPQVRLAKLDTEALPEDAGAYGIRSIPTMILFHGGREIARQSGTMPAGRIVQWVRSTLNG